MKKLMLILIGLAVLAGCAAPTEKSGAQSSYRQISAEEAAEIMAQEENYILLDVRTLEEYQEQHIPGAICIPNEDIGSDEISALPDKDQCILVYCRSGNRSKQASEKLVKLGYTNVVEFGGIIDWPGETVSGVS